VAPRSDSKQQPTSTEVFNRVDRSAINQRAKLATLGDSHWKQKVTRLANQPLLCLRLGLIFILVIKTPSSSAASVCRAEDLINVSELKSLLSPFRPTEFLTTEYDASSWVDDENVTKFICCLINQSARSFRHHMNEAS
jgi:hypothetical protein